MELATPKKTANVEINPELATILEAKMLERKSESAKRVLVQIELTRSVEV